MFKLGVERLAFDPELRRPLQGKRIAIVAHPASVDQDLTHTMDLLARCKDLKITAAFGPQHGMRGEKQDNMVETKTYTDPKYKIPVYSLYGEVRRPTREMMDSFDVVLFDLQDLGCRIYTFITTLLYMMEECARAQKTIWILDRPNPAGRPLEGALLQPGWESFVGAGPLLMRHGLTLGELAQWFKAHFKLQVDLRVIEMENYRINEAPGWGWPMERAWVNPSPNASNLSMARAYSGTVLLEGTHLSEGRGTTRPLEVMGASDIDAEKVLERMIKLTSQSGVKWLSGAILRPCHFEPMFHKHQSKLCSALQIHVDQSGYNHAEFKPYRMVALFFKAIRELYPDYAIWRDFHYEYEKTRLAIDLIHGGPGLREWVDDPASKLGDFEQALARDEKAWAETRKPHLLYR